MSSKIKIILINTSHPGNIGAVARAMKTMGLSQLTLVSPQFFPHPEAMFRAAGADDILENTQVVHSLQEAIQHCQWVIGTSVRQRTLERPVDDPRICAEKIHAFLGKVAIVFVTGVILVIPMPFTSSCLSMPVPNAITVAEESRRTCFTAVRGPSS